MTQINGPTRPQAVMPAAAYVLELYFRFQSELKQNRLSINHYGINELGLSAHQLDNAMSDLANKLEGIYFRKTDGTWYDRTKE